MSSLLLFLLPLTSFFVGASVDTGGNISFDAGEITGFTSVMTNLAKSLLGLFADIGPYAIIFIGVGAIIALVLGIFKRH